MKTLLSHIKQVNKQVFWLYLCSYAIYRAINNAFSNLVLYLLHEESFRERWTDHSIPCGDTPHIFLILFQLYKIVLFVFLIKLIRKQTNRLISEFLIAYFLFDLVYILSFIWDRLPIPYLSNTWWMLVSSGQIFLSRYLPYLDLIIAGVWTSALLIILNKYHKLSWVFLIHRLALISLSVPISFLLIYSVEQFIK